MFVDGVDGLPDKFIGFEINLVVCLYVDVFPKVLEFLFLVNLFLECRLLWFSGIFRFDCRRIEDSVELANDEPFEVINIAKVKCAISLVVEVLFGQFTFFNVAVCNEFFLDFDSLVFGYFQFTAIVCGGNEVDEHLERNLYRAVSHDFGNLGLELFCELVVTLACNDGKDVCGEYVRAEHIRILSLTVFVDAQTHTTADFLALARLVVAVFEGADLEDN